jgi:Ca2+-transporting ATPase
MVVEQDMTAARNYAFSTLVFAELFRSFGARSLQRPFWSRTASTNIRLTLVVVASIALQVVIHHVPALQKVFGIGPISLQACAALLILGTVPLLLLELRKVARFAPYPGPTGRGARVNSGTPGHSEVADAAAPKQ